jgi:DNA-binding winged helix-turn-helix (wHTH) protein
MTTGSFRFERFVLDPADRRLLQDGEAIELNARSLDALTLLVSEQGRMVSKDRFLEDVWRGIPVTDEALTQCIKTLRKQLGDDAASPRFIETVPKHGYRFIAAVEGGPAPSAPAAALSDPWRQVLVLASAGIAGGGVAGAIGGLFYGLAGAAPPSPGVGETSAFLVIFFVTIALAMIGAAGVSLGIALAGLASPRQPLWIIAGGALGGLAVGAFVKLLGLDALALLFGHAPADMTGGAEGLVLGGAAGLGAWLVGRGPSDMSLRRGVVIAGLPGCAAGMLITLLGGRLMAGSLDLLAGSFPGSRVRLETISRLFGENDFGPVSQTATGGLEGLLFAGCVVGAMLLARQRFNPPPGSS